MKISHDAKLDMYNAVIRFCLQNPAIMATLPAAQIALDELQETVALIKETMEQKERPTSGIVADKLTRRKKLIQHATGISNKIYAYAIEIGSNDLKDQVSFAEAALLRLKDEELVIICMIIVAAANANLAALAAYSITQDSVAQFTGLINEFQLEVPRSRNALTNRSGHIKSLVELFKSADTILKKRLDKLIATFKGSHSLFFNTYMSNRIIIDARSRTTQVKGVITDEHGEPVSGAKIEITGGSAVNTRVDGKFVIKTVVPGRYPVTISKEGFQPETITELHVKQGKVNTIELSLKPAA